MAKIHAYLVDLYIPVPDSGKINEIAFILRTPEKAEIPKGKVCISGFKSGEEHFLRSGMADYYIN